MTPAQEREVLIAALYEQTMTGDVLVEELLYYDKFPKEVVSILDQNERALSDIEEDFEKWLSNYVDTYGSLTS